MTASPLFLTCTEIIERCLAANKLYIKFPYTCKAQFYFAQGITINTAIVLSSREGKAGPITRAWGIVFTDPDRPIRCTEVHTSYYGELMVLNKLLVELQNKLAEC